MIKPALTATINHTRIPRRRGTGPNTIRPVIVSTLPSQPSPAVLCSERKEIY